MEILISLIRFVLLAAVITFGAMAVRQRNDESMAHFYCALSASAFAASMGWL